MRLSIRTKFELNKMPVKKLLKKPTLSGPWSAILHGAYKKKPKVSTIRCDWCFKTFIKPCNLANHNPKPFKRCGQYNDTHGRENHLVKVQGLPSYEPPRKTRHVSKTP